jgi:hypothetical protein
LWSTLDKFQPVDPNIVGLNPELEAEVQNWKLNGMLSNKDATNQKTIHKKTIFKSAGRLFVWMKLKTGWSVSPSASRELQAVHLGVETSSCTANAVLALHTLGLKRLHLASTAPRPTHRLSTGAASITKSSRITTQLWIYHKGLRPSYLQQASAFLFLEDAVGICYTNLS